MVDGAGGGRDAGGFQRWNTYSESYQDPAAAGDYAERIYAADSPDSAIWSAESRLLDAILRRRFPDPSRTKAVDFACGTGRILTFLSRRVGELTGVDISPAMLEIARRNVPSARLVCTDVTRDAGGLPESADLITTFRFVLMAEPALRAACLRALVQRLSPDGVLIVGIHGNPASYRAAADLRNRLTGRLRLPMFSLRDMRRLADEIGVEIIDSTGCGFIPQSLGRLLPAAAYAWIERALAGVPLLWRLGCNLIVVCRRRRERGSA